MTSYILNNDNLNVREKLLRSTELVVESVSIPPHVQIYCFHLLEMSSSRELLLESTFKKIFQH
jgi:hypothetical protein